MREGKTVRGGLEGCRKKGGSGPRSGLSIHLFIYLQISTYAVHEKETPQNESSSFQMILSVEMLGAPSILIEQKQKTEY